MAYLLSGTYAQASRDTGIPSETIRSWAQTDWWEEMLEKAIRDTSAELRAVGMKIVKKATEAVLDRLENGDEVTDRNGNKFRRKVALKDALLASLTWFDKNRIINDQSSRFTDNRVNPKELIKQMVEIGKRVKDGTLADLPIPEDTKEGENVRTTTAD